MEIPPEPPECPVCFNLYDAVLNIPRVLSCGHSTCEDCLSQLPNPFPNTISCPSCTQPVKLPDRLSSLPKNIDLLRLSYSLRSHSDNLVKVISENPPSVLSELDHGDNVCTPSLWSREFYLNWKNWVLPKDCVLVELNSEKRDGFSNLCYGKIVKNVNNGNSSCGKCVLRENEEVGLVKVGTFRAESEKREETVGSLSKTSSEIKYNYEAKIMKVLFFMKENDRDELGLVLKTSLKLHKVGRICGFWCNEEDNCVFIACEGFRRGLTKSMGELENGFLGKSEDEVEKVSKLGGFGMIGMEICEVVKDLHVEGLIVGCLGVSCFGLDEFSHVFVDFGEVLAMGRRVWSMVAGNEDQEDKALQKYMFVCPEVLIEQLRNEGIELGDGSLRYEVGYGSDVWSLACVLIWLLAGKQFAEEMYGYYNCLFTAVSDQEGRDFVDLYIGWKEKIIAFLGVRLGSELMPLKDVLSKCLDFDPGKRPVLIEVWKCIRKLVVTPKFDVFFYPETELMMGISGYCIGLSNLCQSVIKTKKGRFIQAADDLLVKDEIGGKAVHQDEVYVVDGVSSAHVKCIGPKAHLDCTTGLAVGVMDLSQLSRSGLKKSTTSASSSGKSSQEASDKGPPSEALPGSTELAPPDTARITTPSLPPLPLEPRTRCGKRNVPTSFALDKPPSKRIANTPPTISVLSFDFSQHAEFGFLSQLNPANVPISYVPVSHPGDHFCPSWGFNRNSRILYPALAHEWLGQGVLPRDLDSLRQLNNEELINVLALSASQNATLSTRAIEVIRASEHSMNLRSELENEKKKVADLEGRILLLEGDVRKQQELESRAQQELTQVKATLETEQKELTRVKANLATEVKESESLRSKNQALNSSILLWERQCKSLERKYNFHKGTGSGQIVENFLRSDEFVQLVSKINVPVAKLGYNEAIRFLQQEHLPHKSLEELGFDANAGAEVDSTFKEVIGGGLGFSVTQFIPSTPLLENPDVDVSELEKDDDRNQP